MNTVKIKTECGDIVGLDNGSYVEFRGIKYADAGRWEYPVVTDGWDGVSLCTLSAIAATSTAVLRTTQRLTRFITGNSGAV